MVKKVNKFIRKILFTVFNSLGLFSLLSCIGTGPDMYGMPDSEIVMYGMPPNYRSVHGIVRGSATNADSSGEPVKGIEYSYKGQALEILYDDDGNKIGERTPVTDENGCFYIELWESEESVTVTFKDIDGDENGSYNTKTETIVFPKDTTFVNKDITLDSK